MNAIPPSRPSDGRGVPHSYTLFCPPLPTSPRVARDFVASALGSLGLAEAVDAVVLCTSELLTNAVVHATGCGALLWLAIEVSHVRVTVYDGSVAPPCPQVVGDGGESGRGLYLVEALADAWGTTAGAPLGLGGTPGKGVWFQITRPFADVIPGDAALSV